MSGACQRCGARLQPVRAEWGGVAIEKQPAMCLPCISHRSQRASEQSATAMAKARERADTLPKGLQVWPRFQHIVDEAMAQMAPKSAVVARGGPGSGKTVLCWGVGRAWQRRGLWVHYQPCLDLRDFSTLNEVAGLLKASDVLLLDGLFRGRGKVPGLVLDRIESALEYRRNTERRTLITTAETYAGIAERSDANFASRLRIFADRRPMLCLPGGADE